MQFIVKYRASYLSESAPWAVLARCHRDSKVCRALCVYCLAQFAPLSNAEQMRCIKEWSRVMAHRRSRTVRSEFTPMATSWPSTSPPTLATN